MFNIAVFISGTGSNLQAIINAIQQQNLAANIVAVVSDNSSAAGLNIAKQFNIPTLVTNDQNHLLNSLANYSIDLLVLAGFMKILSADFVNHYAGKIINIHPSLLPKYRGLNTYQRVLAAEDHEHGCSVHLVTDELDAGPIIAQTKIKVTKQDTPASLESKVQAIEHQLYPLVINWFAEGRLQVVDGQIILDRQKLLEPVMVDF